MQRRLGSYRGIRRVEVNRKSTTLLISSQLETIHSRLHQHRSYWQARHLKTLDPSILCRSQNSIFINIVNVLYLYVTYTYFFFWENAFWDITCVVYDRSAIHCCILWFASLTTDVAVFSRRSSVCYPETAKNVYNLQKINISKCWLL